MGENRSLLRREILGATASPTGYRSRLFARPKTGPSVPVQFTSSMLSSTPAALIGVVVPLAESKAAATVQVPRRKARSRRE